MLPRIPDHHYVGLPLPNRPVTQGTPTTRHLFAMAWPLGLKAVMLHGIIVIDAFLVAPLGESALAAMGLAGALAGLLLGILFAFSNATQIRIAQAFGAAAPVALKTSLYCGLFINLAMTAIGLTAVGLFGGFVIEAFAQTPQIADAATAYLYVFLWVVGFEAIGQCLASHFNGTGKTKLPFYSYLISVPINVVISIALIHGLYGLPVLGVLGAAYGSAAASAARVAYLIWEVLRKDRDILTTPGWSKPRFKEALARHWAFSLPIAGTFVSMSIGTQVCMLIYATMSVNEFAALTLIMPWVNTAGVFGMAWAQATGIAVAQLLGRKMSEPALDEFLSRAWRGAFVAAGIVAIAYAVICLSANLLYQDLEAETTAMLLMFLPILLVLPFPKGSNATCGQTLRAAGDTIYVMHVFNGAQWLFKVPLTALFVLYLDLHVAWVFSLVMLEEFVKLPPFHLRLFKGDWKRAEVLDD